jgi:hypothetical protein
MARQRLPGATIKAAIVAEAERLNFASDAALAIGSAILGGAHHAR